MWSIADAGVGECGGGVGVGSAIGGLPLALSRRVSRLALCQELQYELADVTVAANAHSLKISPQTSSPSITNILAPSENRQLDH